MVKVFCAPEGGAIKSLDGEILTTPKSPDFITMVNSRINHDINYAESREINDEDLGYSSSIYEIDVDSAGADGEEITLSIVIGRPKLTYVSKNIIYFPIYVISTDDKIKAQIGVFEVSAGAKDITRYTDPDLEIDEAKLGEPLLYSFATSKFLKKAAAAAAAAPVAAEKEKTSTEAVAEKEYEDEKKEDEKKDVEDAEEEDDIFDLEPRGDVPDTDDGATYKIPKMGEIFTRAAAQQQRTLPELPEETATDKNKYKREYHETKNTQWVEKFFQNNHFRITENQGGGDCFFYVVRDAFAQLGYMTTIAKLRNLVSENATTAQFDFYQTMYTTTKTNLLEIEATIKKHVEINKDLRKKSKVAKTREEEDTIVKAAKENLETMKKLEEEKKEAASLHRDFEFMANIDTLEKLRRHMKEPAYWADLFAITILEKHLRVKFIILSEADFERDATDFVLQCGEQIEGTFAPFFYIITTYSGDHYRLVSYKEHKILKFREIPYAIKVLIMSKCMERMAGSYNKILEFKQLKEHYGIEDVPEEQQAEEDELNAATAAAANLYDRGDVEFMFHAKSAHARVGKGVGEVVPTEKIVLYRELDTIKDWRRAFDDTYEEAPFELHGKRWKSVEIYYQGAKFRKQNTPFYELFSLDSGNEIGTSLELAKIAGSIDGKGTIKTKTGEKKTVVLRDKTKIKIDADFYNGVRNHDERRAAIREKFKQHPQLRRALALTKRALLKQFRPRKEPEPDVELMEVREELMEDIET